MQAAIVIDYITDTDVDSTALKLKATHSSPSSSPESMSTSLSSSDMILAPKESTVTGIGKIADESSAATMECVRAVQAVQQTRTM